MLTLPDGTEKKAMLRASTFLSEPVQGNVVRATPVKFLLCYSGLHALKLTIDTEKHTIGEMSPEEELARDYRV